MPTPHLGATATARRTPTLLSLRGGQASEPLQRVPTGLRSGLGRRGRDPYDTGRLLRLAL